MSLKIAIFEDDKELADFLQETLEVRKFTVSVHYSLKDTAWHGANVVLGDFRNKIVSFESLRLACVKEAIPLIAISGFETNYRPQLLKPFSMEEMLATTLQAISSKI